MLRRVLLVAAWLALTLPLLRADEAAWRVERAEFGEESVEGRPLGWRVFGAEREDAPTVLLLGAIHGDEPMSHRLLEGFAAELERHPEWAAGRRVVLATPLNPDGLARGTRANARGVDLNRNFPASSGVGSWRPGEARGAAPLSEPESRLVAHLLETFRPLAVVSVHAPFRCVNWDGPAEGLARAMAAENGYELRPSIGYPTPGSLGAWLGGDRQVPIVTLELPRGRSDDGFLEQNRAALRAALAWAP
jgi:protein MpaA